ncbi:MAG: type II toxin-antitoxin system HicB family antitoxin [Ignavibacteria bacterium]|nr:type II toxin-antitoxin system HicB family antitoxin [Ignavibacteria bacterium]
MKIIPHGYEYTIFVHETEEGGFIADIPSLPGCMSQRETLEETIAFAKEATDIYLQALLKRKKLL